MPGTGLRNLMKVKCQSEMNHSNPKLFQGLVLPPESTLSAPRAYLASQTLAVPPLLSSIYCLPTSAIQHGFFPQSQSTANFTLPLTEDISHVHTTFRETVVPFRSRWEIDDLVKVTSWSLFLMLDIELHDVVQGLDAWGHASIPGPDPNLRDQIRGLRRSIPVFQPSESDAWTPLAWACARVVQYTVRDSAARIFNAPSPAKKIDMISIYWYRMSRYNQNLIRRTEALGSFIQGLRHTEEGLIQIRQQLLA